MITVKNSDTQNLEVTGRSIRGVSVNAVLYANAAGTAMTGVLVDQTKIRVKVIVTRANGRVHVVYNDQIRYANALSAYRTPGFIYFQNSTKDVQLANATGVVEKAILPMLIDFGKPYTLRGADKILVEVNTTGFCSDGSVSTTSSYLEVVSIDDDGNGVDDCDVEIKAYSIQASKTADQVSLGDGVTDILFYNSDKTDILDASAPLAQATIDSDEHKASNITQNSLLAMRNNMFTTKAESDLRYQSFKLYTGSSLHNAKVDLTLNGSNVNASACYVIWRKKIRTADSLKRGNDFIATKQAIRYTKAGLPGIAAKINASKFSV